MQRAMHNVGKAISYHLLSVLMFVISCNGQNKTQPQQIGNERKEFRGGQPRIIKTQGTDRSANVHCGLRDKAGNLWFGTTGEGVYRYDGKSFTNFTTKDGLNNNTVWSMVEDEAGNIWFGTDDGLCRYDGRTISNMPI